MSPQIVTKPHPALFSLIKPLREESRRKIGVEIITDKFGPTHKAALVRSTKADAARSGRTSFRPIRSTDEISLVKNEIPDIYTPIMATKPQIVSTIPAEAVTPSSMVSAQPVFQAVETTTQAPEFTEAGAGIPPALFIVGGILALTLFGAGKSTRSKGAPAW